MVAVWFHPDSGNLRGISLWPDLTFALVWYTAQDWPVFLCLSSFCDMASTDFTRLPSTSSRRRNDMGRRLATSGTFGLDQTFIV